MQLLVALLLCAAAVASHAQTSRAPEPRPPGEERWNQVELQAEATREVRNDTVYATLFTELTDVDAAKLAAQVDRAIAEALRTAGVVRGVKAKSGNSMTFPVYDKAQKLTGWRARAEIRIESQDFESAAALIGRLQSKLQLANLAFGVSRELRRRTEDELIKEAIAAFKSRSEVVTSALGGRSYRIQRVALSTGGIFPPPQPWLRAQAPSSAELAAAAPVFEGGTSALQVQASGTIEVE